MQEKVTEKSCIDCRVTKPISEFYVKEHRKYSTHYFSRCKSCYYKWVYERDKKQGFKWHGMGERNARARYLLKKAVKDGTVIKPTNCERCKKPTPSYELAGHHHDYTKPLDVIWLCRECHKKEHDLDAAPSRKYNKRGGEA